MELGKRIEDIRKAIGMTQYDLSARSGFSQSRISRIENNMTMDMDEISTLSEVFGITEIELIDTRLSAEKIARRLKRKGEGHGSNVAASTHIESLS